MQRRAHTTVTRHFILIPSHHNNNKLLGGIIISRSRGWLSMHYDCRRFMLSVNEVWKSAMYRAIESPEA